MSASPETMDMGERMRITLRKLVTPSKQFPKAHDSRMKQLLKMEYVCETNMAGFNGPTAINSSWLLHARQQSI
ncbi:hypothetical protein RJ639_046221 [Escallonia herrerae]|uniref:Uncharacterized protein n=1 Tax=Escallonia herrerae TaxID=1293975 RepID=A0AA88W439_9ASTE|nr:hypothetical protein RJ639_025407 [Escallonia herrerae]KAK3020532.1 hypothetical protein RJ639_046221 [Escallonia herrerae]